MTFVTDESEIFTDSGIPEMVYPVIVEGDIPASKVQLTFALTSDTGVTVMFWIRGKYPLNTTYNGMTAVEPPTVFVNWLPKAVQFAGYEKDARAVQPLNADPPMLRNNALTVTADKDVQPPNAPSPIELRAVGRAMEVSPVQPLNAPDPRDATDTGNVKDVNPVHPEKAESPIFVTEGGNANVTDVREVLFMNRLSDISVNALPIVTDCIGVSASRSVGMDDKEFPKTSVVNPEQFESAALPIDVTESGMVIDDRALQFLNACAPMLVSDEESANVIEDSAEQP